MVDIKNTKKYTISITFDKKISYNNNMIRSITILPHNKISNLPSEIINHFMVKEMVKNKSINIINKTEQKNSYKTSVYKKSDSKSDIGKNNSKTDKTDKSEKDK